MKQIREKKYTRKQIKDHEMWMNAALGLVSKSEGNSRHLNSAPDATIILVRAEERGRGFLSYLPSFFLFYF